MSSDGGPLEIGPPVDEADRAWLENLWREAWVGDFVVSAGRVRHLADVEALIARAGGERLGAATYAIDGEACELTSINALTSWRGVGTALLASVEAAARTAGCLRLWLVTTNDNLDALRFYQRRGYRLTAVRPGALDETRKLKPTIPARGNYGIPLRDELELEKPLSAARPPGP